jgi:uncharacterized protein (DUF1330 family)
LEGNWGYSRTVLIKFESINDFIRRYNSDEYQTIVKHRLKAADGDTIYAKGLDLRILILCIKKR